MRRFTFDPGADVLLNIESVNILDLQPPSPIKGIGTGTVCVVGEFENGPFGTVLEATSTTDFVNTWGLLGYTYGGVQANNPSARVRFADGTLAGENWNGNGFVQLQGKQYARLLVCRADTSVGNVQLLRRAFVTGAAAFRYQLVSGQVLELDAGAGPQDATFTGASATVTSGAQTFPTAFAGGETLTLGADAMPNFTVTFLAADQTQAAVIARINQYAGFAFAATVTGTTMSLTGLVAGLSGQVRVVAASAPGVLTTLGLVVANAAGTGDVGNIAAVTPTEIATIVQAAVSNAVVEVDPSGALRVSNSGGFPFVRVGAGTTATNLGFTAGQLGTDNGEAVLVSGAGTYPTGFAGGETLTLQVGANKPAVITTFLVGDQTLAAVVAEINAAFTAAGQGTPVAVDGAARFTVEGIGSGLGDVVKVVGASAGGVLTALGLVVGSTFGTATPTGSLPAGTVVQQPSGQVFVTMQDVDFTAGGVLVGGVSKAAGGVIQPVKGPYVVKIRHAQDDGTGTAAGAGTVTQIPAAPQIGSFSVVNPAATTAALTEAQIDAAYATAIGSTVNLNSVAKQINLIFSARQSNTVRRQLRTNALTASAGGSFGRMAMIRPPLNTDEPTATSTTAEPGVGAYRSDRVVYCYIGSNVFIQAIATAGLGGGVGFTADGNVDVGSDSLAASILSQLPPEEDPGQLTPFTTGVNGIETGANVQNFDINDYIAFKAAGIMALRVDDGVVIFQSGATAVDPLVFPNLVNIARRRMADFIQDSIAQRAKSFGKRLSTNARRHALKGEITQFMDGLLGKNSPNDQRIDSYSLNDKQNTPALLGQGRYRLLLLVRTLNSLKSIEIETVIGETVDVNELPQAA